MVKAQVRTVLLRGLPALRTERRVSHRLELRVPDFPNIVNTSGSTNDGLRVQLVSNADARGEIIFIPLLRAAPKPAIPNLWNRRGSCEGWVSRKQITRSGADESRNNRMVPPEIQIYDGVIFVEPWRFVLVAQTEVYSQLRSYPPLVLNE